MIYLPGLANGGLSSKAGTGPEAAFYLSGGDLTSLTFGDIVARTAFYRAMVDVETMIGLATFTLALTYVLTAFDSMARLRALYARVRRNTIHPNRPATILERRYRSGDASALTAFLSATVEDLEAYVEGLRRFPVVFYFHTRRTARSTPRIFATLGDVVELIRWGLPAGEPPVDDPTLLALMDSYRTALERLRRSFVGPHPLPGVEVPDLATFTSQLDDPQSPAGRFRELQRAASRAADLPEPAVDGAGREREYARFRRWWEFHRYRELLLARVAVALGY